MVNPACRKKRLKGYLIASFNMESTKINQGPESPADLEWSQGAKNPRKENQTSDYIVSDHGTLPSDTNDSNESGTETSDDEICADDDNPDGPSIDDTTAPTQSNIHFPRSKKKRRKLRRHLTEAIQIGSTNTNHPLLRDMPSHRISLTLQPSKKWYKVRLRKNKEVFAEIMKNPFLVAILSGGNMQGLLTQKQSDIIMKKITEKIYLVPEERISPKIEMSTFRDGFLLINCFNEQTAMWMKKLDYLDLWEAGTARALSQYDFQEPYRYSTFVPGSFRTSRVILNLLSLQNPGIYALENFNVIRRGEKTENDGILFVFEVPDICVERIDALNKKLYCGLKRIPFIFTGTYKSARKSPRPYRALGKKALRNRRRRREKELLKLQSGYVDTPLEEFNKTILISKPATHLGASNYQERNFAENLPQRQQQANRYFTKYPQSDENPGASNYQESNFPENLPQRQQQANRYFTNYPQSDEQPGASNYQESKFPENLPQKQQQANRYFTNYSQSDEQPVLPPTTQASKKPIQMRLGSPPYPPPKYDGIMTFSEYFESLKGTYYGSTPSLPSKRLRSDEKFDEPISSRSCEMYHEEGSRYYESDHPNRYDKPELSNNSKNFEDDNEPAYSKYSKHQPYESAMNIAPNWQGIKDKRHNQPFKYSEGKGSSYSMPQSNPSSSHLDSDYNMPSKRIPQKEKYQTSTERSGYWYTENTNRSYRASDSDYVSDGFTSSMEQSNSKQFDSFKHPEYLNQDKTPKESGRFKRNDPTKYSDSVSSGHIPREQNYERYLESTSTYPESSNRSTRITAYGVSEPYDSTRYPNSSLSDYNTSAERDTLKYDSSNYPVSSSQKAFYTEALGYVRGENSSDYKSRTTQNPPERDFTAVEYDSFNTSRDRGGSQYRDSSKYAEFSKFDTEAERYKRSEDSSYSHTSRYQESSGSDNRIGERISYGSSEYRKRDHNSRDRDSSKYSDSSKNRDLPKYYTEAEKYLASLQKHSVHQSDSSRHAKSQTVEKLKEHDPSRYQDRRERGSSRNADVRSFDQFSCEAERYVESLRRKDSSNHSDSIRPTEAEKFLESARRRNITREREPKLTEAERFLKSSRRDNEPRQYSTKKTEAEKFLEHSRRGDHPPQRRRFSPY